MKTNVSRLKKQLGRAAITVLALMLPAMSLADLIRLAPKTTQTIQVPEGVKRIIVSDPSVVTAEPTRDGRGILLIAEQLGRSELRVEKLVGDDLVSTVEVLEDTEVLVEQLSVFLKDIEGLEIRAIGNRVAFTGELLSKADWDYKEKIKSAFSQTILDTSKMSSLVDKLLAEKLEQEIDIPTVTARVSQGTVFLEGYVYDEADMQRANSLAQHYAVRVVSLIKMQEVMIETDVYFVQVDTSDAKSFGNNVLKTFSVDADVGFSGGSDTLPTSTFNVSGNLQARINALVGKGNAKVLASPHLSTKSGDQGEFHSGGELFIPVAGNVSGDLESVRFGVILKVKPTLRGKDHILNEISVEISVPNADAGGGQVALDTFRTSSTTLTHINESVMISGLIQTIETEFKEKTPLLGDIPLLKEFFSERQKRFENRELVVVLVPRPVFPKVNEGPAFSEERRAILDR